MTEIIDFILLFLRQFAGGPGPVENNLVRFGLPSILWFILWYIAWSRQRKQDHPRERLLLWGFGLAFLRELYMFALMAWKILGSSTSNITCDVIQPLEHALAMAAMIVVAGAFLRYILDDQKTALRFIRIGIGITAVVFIYTSLTWPGQLAATPTLKFHQTWAAWLFHIPLSILMGVTVFLLWKKRGWLRNVVATSLTLYLLSELLLLLNYATNQAYNSVICPIGNSLHIIAIPLLGFVYLQEQAIEKKQAEDALIAYRDHLEELVGDRTSELTELNSQLVKEVAERTLAETALKRLTQRYGLILKSAGEGICGIDNQGRMTFVNEAAARILGYQVDELINLPSHLVWHQHKIDGRPYPLEECPFFQGYSKGIQHSGDDEYFWRKDGSGFPTSYFSNPIWENDQLVGTVIVFSDITERKRIEAEIAQHTTSLTTQNSIAAILSQSLDVEVNLASVLDIVRNDSGMDLGMILLSEPDCENLSLYLHSGQYKAEDIQAMLMTGQACQQLSIQAFTRNQTLTAGTRDASTEGIDACMEQAGLNNLISVPLSSKGRILGVLTLGTKQLTSVPVHKQEMLTAIGQQIGMAIENSRLYKDAGSWANDLTRLHEASSFLSSSFNIDQINTEIARQSAWLLKCQKSFVIRLLRQRDTFELASEFSINEAGKVLIEECISEWKFLKDLASNPGTIPIRDALSDERLPMLIKDKLAIKSALLVPIWTSDKPTEYIILIDSQAKRQWNVREIELIEILANRAAVALVYATLEQQLELDAALQERQRIAANMHDGLSQTISLLGLHVDKMQEVAEGYARPDTLKNIEEIRNIVNHAFSEVRRAITNLQEMPAQPKSLQVLLKDLLAELQTTNDPELMFTTDLDQELFLVDEQTNQVLLVVQEAILNACHHARAHAVSVHLEKVGDRIQVCIEDNGSGFDVKNQQATTGHFGLTIMQARASRIGGTLQIDTNPGKGTRINLFWIPEVNKAHKSIIQPSGRPASSANVNRGIEL